MKTMILTKEQCNVEPCVATIGFFDGVHRGHRHLIRQVVEAAKEEGNVDGDNLRPSSAAVSAS